MVVWTRVGNLGPPPVASASENDGLGRRGAPGSIDPPPIADTSRGVIRSDEVLVRD
jgi:hypothetical protein